MTRLYRSPVLTVFSLQLLARQGLYQTLLEYMSRSLLLVLLHIISLSPVKGSQQAKEMQVPVAAGFGASLENSAFWKCWQGTAFKALLGNV